MQAADRLEQELANYLSLGDTKYQRKGDSFGYRWLVFKDTELADTVAAVAKASGGFAGSGFKDNLLCAVFAFKGGGKEVIYLVYSFKEGGFYPFIPTDREKNERDLEREFLLAAKLGGHIAVVEDRSQWFPLWGTPIDLS